jgi:transposase
MPLTDIAIASGIRLGVVVSDFHGKSARAMVKAIIVGQTPNEVLKLASARLKASREEIFDALQGDLTASHRFVLDELMCHIEAIATRIDRFDFRLLAELESERNTLALLQTIPGGDLIGAAMLLIEIGTDMDGFGNADRLASWVDICLGSNASAGKRKSGHIRKGNLYVRRLLCVNLPMPPGAPRRYSSRSSSLWSSGANITGIPPPTMKPCPFKVMPLTGSRL